MKVSVLYIAGFTRSGSTLTDIVIGNHKGYFSAGEVIYFIQNGLFENEFCSCSSRVQSCPVWSRVLAEWDKVRVLSLSEYDKLYFENFTNRGIGKLFLKLMFPGKKFKALLVDTRELYKAIAIVSGATTIIDSSKSPFRILLFRSLGFNLRVVHVIRELRGVLFSSFKYLPKDSPAGVEVDIKPKGFWFVVVKWAWVNLLSLIFSLGIKRDVLRFENLLEQPEMAMEKLGFRDELFLRACENGGPFFCGHIVAGGRIRMKGKVFINSGLGAQERWSGTGIKELVVRCLDFFTSGSK